MSELTQLGSKVGIWNSPDEAIIERIPIRDPAIRKAVVRLSAPEFTSLCPVTGQPDFARIYIDYIPRDFLIESKSLKLFLGSFRNHGSFHEECTVKIGTRIRDEIRPTWIRVAGVWFPRGGIPIDVFWQDGSSGQVMVPPLKIQLYIGR